MGNILQVRPPNPSISHCSKLAEARATENRRQTNRSLTAQSTSPIPQGPWKKGSAGPGAQQVIVHALGRAWAFLEDFGIKLPVINSHWPQFSYEGRNPKAPEKKIQCSILKGLAWSLIGNSQATGVRRKESWAWQETTCSKELEWTFLAEGILGMPFSFLKTIYVYTKKQRGKTCLFWIPPYICRQRELSSCVHNTEKRACKAQCCVCLKLLPLILPLGLGRKDNCWEAQRRQARWPSSYRQEACVSNDGGFSSQACLYKIIYIYIYSFI